MALTEMIQDCTVAGRRVISKFLMHHGILKKVTLGQEVTTGCVTSYAWRPKGDSGCRKSTLISHVLGHQAGVCASNMPSVTFFAYCKATKQPIKKHSTNSGGTWVLYLDPSFSRCLSGMPMGVPNGMPGAGTLKS